jgi:hypothetical protein
LSQLSPRQFFQRAAHAFVTHLRSANRLQALMITSIMRCPAQRRSSEKMRAVLALVMILAAGGCSDAGWRTVAGHVDPDALFGGDPDENAVPSLPAPHSNAKCRDLAFDRSSDVADQGFDEQVRQAVYASTYADCVAWAARGSAMVEK